MTGNPSRPHQRTRLYFHPASLLHDPPPHIGFAPARLESILKSLEGSRFEGLLRGEGTPADRSFLALAHTDAFIDKVLRSVSPGDTRSFDLETFSVVGTSDAALASAGQTKAATEDVIAQKVRNAFCLASPGGHHAEAEAAMGYCFFNHAALGAIFAQTHKNVGRVAVVDFDVHHGNGTQQMFWNSPERLFISLHEESALSGFAHETGCADNILNIPLKSGAGGETLRQIMEQIVLPKLRDFRPDMIFASAGFDMHAADPLGGLFLNEDDYLWLGRTLSQGADQLCGGKFVAVLEGGYDLKHLAMSVAAFIEGMMMGPQ